MAQRPLFKRAHKLRLGYRWVRRIAYGIIAAGFLTAMAGKTQSTPGKLSQLELTGYGLCLIAFTLFLASYGFYIAIRIAESRPVARAAGDDEEG